MGNWVPKLESKKGLILMQKDISTKNADIHHSDHYWGKISHQKLKKVLLVSDAETNTMTLKNPMKAKTM